MDLIDAGWVPEACTLPTVERPLRTAEFDRLFAETATGVERVTRHLARVTLPSTPEVAARAAHLTVRETRCCSFFTFALTATEGRLHLDVTVPESQIAVLDALVQRALP